MKFRAMFLDGEANVRLAFCRILDRCGTAGEVQAYSSAYPISDSRTNELVRNLAMLVDFEQKFITNNPHAVDNLYMKLLDRTPCPGKTKVIFVAFLYESNWVAYWAWE
jgi:hypothetical protein